MKGALVTGANGYIGSVLCKMLKEQGYRVAGIDIEDGIGEEYCDQFYHGDFAEFVGFALPTDTVFHLAANSLLGPSAKDPLPYYLNNTAMTVSLISSLGPQNRFIFASTAAVYKNDVRVKTEDQAPEPPNNYGLSKLMVEQVLDKCHEASKIKAVSFRFFNVIGAYGDVGQKPDTPHVVNQLIDKTLQKKPFKLNGDDYATPDGTCIRDYLHVEDVCRALIHADEYLRKRKSPCHKVYNLGTKTGTSVSEIVESFKRVTGSKVKVKVGPKRIGDPDRLIADPSLFIRDTGFKYKYGPKDLDKMILSAWEYRNGSV